ncbi:MAG: SDR family oxidoreductase [Sandaracinus sp.]|nr:SDR family oxidoreductase [Sandaracinus sp.]
MSVVVVTGATRGIGLALTDHLLRRGDEVIATFRDDEGRRRLEALDPRRGRLLPRALEVRDVASIARFAASLDASSVDVVIHSAGIMGAARLQDVTSEEWLDVLSVNVLGPFHVTTALLPNLRKSARPRVITLSSLMSCLHRKTSGHYAYRSSKAAMNKVMQLLATDLASEGIVVCPVNPGWVRTDMGGPDAPLSVDESARGLLSLVDRLTPEDSGRLWQWDGTELAW